MSQFIIATHSYLADGYKHSIKFFNTEVKNIHFINAYTEEKNNFVEELEKLLNEFKDEQVTILTDLPGGSVNKESASLIKKYNCNVISGINLSLVLELVLSSDEVHTDETIRAAVEQARSQIVFMNDLLKGDDL
ncbi:PTS N-acetylglucosamine transporter subunit IIBC [uncultured Lactobacillus sp.]|uniref:PTS sugar transporter subunit IIA n=1 Tax=uncultured Lactobacillus sp. TaxID=153152 RepID=UPI0025EF0927|nr:PTS N-acetylglucosamine transporter subunit IIBC [uncultured Lactobacillus sp.]